MGRHEGDGTGPLKIISTGRHADYAIGEDVIHGPGEAGIDGPDRRWPIPVILLMVIAVIGLIMILGSKMLGSESGDPEGSSSGTPAAVVEIVTETVKVPGPAVTKTVPGPETTVTVQTRPTPVPGPTVKVPGPTVTKTVTAPPVTRRVTAPAKTVTKTVTAPAETETVIKCPAEVLDPLCP